MLMDHNYDVWKQFRNQSTGIDTRYFLNSEVSKPIMKPDYNVSKPLLKPDENVSKPIMKQKYNKYILIN